MQPNQQDFANLLETFYSETDAKRQDILFEQLSRISPDPEWSDYIFHSDDFVDSHGKLDAKGAAEKIFNHKPICL